MHPETRALLIEINATEGWFRARKTRPIWVLRMDQSATVRTLEGEQYVPAGAYLCRGEAAELWPQSAESLASKYCMTDAVDPEGWRKWMPKPDQADVMAAQVPRAFDVYAKWGHFSGKPGDYLVKGYQDRANGMPDDVWIVDQEVFRATYDRLDEAG